MQNVKFCSILMYLIFIEITNRLLKAKTFASEGNMSRFASYQWRLPQGMEGGRFRYSTRMSPKQCLECFATKFYSF